MANVVATSSTAAQDDSWSSNDLESSMPSSRGAEALSLRSEPPSSARGVGTGTQAEHAVVTDSEWEDVREDRRRLLEGARLAPDRIDSLPSRIGSYYRNQNSLLDMMRLAEFPVEQESQDEQSRLAVVKWTVYASFGCNIALLLIKSYAAIASRSLSVIASMVDSVLDLLSGLIMFFTERAIQKRDPYKYPVGRRRLEPLGIIVFASVMGTAALQIISSSVQSLVARSKDLNLKTPTLVILGLVIFTKASLFAWCRIIGRRSPMVAALSTDHIMDVLTNSVAVVMVLLAFYVKALWWCDGVGAIILALWIIRTWFSKGYEHLVMMAGRAAPLSFVNKITYLAYQHHKDVVVDTVRAYHVGLHYVVEVDIMLPRETPLHVAHDIGENLERKIEALDEVERAFVHIDHETDHKPEHKVR
eukprot:a676835_141.p1 GENE.a676835_141~~a676835_141.p1  ORF type:complete len:427 (-),score=160.62 a676835_141:13-1263(-)